MILMQDYHISPDEAHSMFLLSIHRFLLAASIASLLIAFILNLILTKRAVQPISEMTRLIGQIAHGNYNGRIHTNRHDEVGNLAQAFNHLIESLQRTEQLRYTMVVDMAHELRTPLSNLRGYLEGIQDGVIAYSPRTISILSKEVQRLIDLVENLQRLTRADAAKGHLSYSSINISNLLDELMPLFRPKLESKHLKYRQTITADANRVFADRHLLIQILSNLLDNAIRYTPMNGWIALNTSSDSDMVYFNISNICQNLSEDDLQKLTERFYRPEKSRSRDSGGAGIGLSIVKQLVEAHQGRLKSRLITEGIEFCFGLPHQPVVLPS